MQNRVLNCFSNRKAPLYKCLKNVYHKCLSRGWQNDAIKTKMQARFILHHSNTFFKEFMSWISLHEMSCLLRKRTIVYLFASTSSTLLNKMIASKTTKVASYIALSCLNCLCHIYVTFLWRMYKLFRYLMNTQALLLV